MRATASAPPVTAMPRSAAASRSENTCPEGGRREGAGMAWGEEGAGMAWGEEGAPRVNKGSRGAAAAREQQAHPLPEQDRRGWGLGNRLFGSLV